eukprot:tig00000403_g329.t1
MAQDSGQASEQPPAPTPTQEDPPAPAQAQDALRPVGIEQMGVQLVVGPGVRVEGPVRVTVAGGGPAPAVTVVMGRPAAAPQPQPSAVHAQQALGDLQPLPVLQPMEIDPAPAAGGPAPQPASVAHAAAVPAGRQVAAAAAAARPAQPQPPQPPQAPRAPAAPAAPQAPSAASSWREMMPESAQRALEAQNPEMARQLDRGRLVALDEEARRRLRQAQLAQQQRGAEARAAPSQLVVLSEERALQEALRRSLVDTRTRDGSEEERAVRLALHRSEEEERLRRQAAQGPSVLSEVRAAAGQPAAAAAAGAQGSPAQLLEEQVRRRRAAQQLLDGRIPVPAGAPAGPPGGGGARLEEGARGPQVQVREGDGQVRPATALEQRLMRENAELRQRAAALASESEQRQLEARRAAAVTTSSVPPGCLRVDEEHLRTLPAAELDELSERLVEAMGRVNALAREARRREASPLPATFECPVCLEALERAKRRVLQPCGHVVCEACGGRVLVMQPQRCPVARCEIYAMSPVYD